MRKSVASLLAIFPLLSLAQFGGVFGPGLDPDHDPLFKEKTLGRGNEVTKCSVNTYSGKRVDLNQKGYDLNLIYDLIKTSDHANEKIIEFGKTGIEPRPLSRFMRQNMELPNGVAALFQYTGNEAKIYIDYQVELGIVAITTFHEIIHALDQTAYDAFHQEVEKVDAYQKVYKKAYELASLRTGMKVSELKEGDYLNEDEKKLIDEANLDYQRLSSRLNYVIEKKAFDHQDVLLKDFKEKHPCFESYIEEHRRVNGFKIMWETNDEHIFKLYPKIKPELLN